METIKTVQWNIGGGKLLRGGAGPSQRESYVADGLEYVIEFLRAHNPDIITLQETHTHTDYCQSEQIADTLGYPGRVSATWADSHLDPGMRLGQSILSRYPIQGPANARFVNPQLPVVWEEGMSGMTHDKGVTRGTVQLESGREVGAQTFQAIPFRHTGLPLTSEPLRGVLGDMAGKLLAPKVGIIQADINIDTPSLRPYFPGLFAAGYEEMLQAAPTNVRGRRYDHVMYSGMRVLSSMAIESVRTDHFPLVTVFELKDL